MWRARFTGKGNYIAASGANFGVSCLPFAANRSIRRADARQIGILHAVLVLFMADSGVTNDAGPFRAF